MKTAKFAKRSKAAAVGAAPPDAQAAVPSLEQLEVMHRQLEEEIARCGGAGSEFAHNATATSPCPYCGLEHTSDPGDYLCPCGAWFGVYSRPQGPMWRPRKERIPPGVIVQTPTGPILVYPAPAK